MEKTEILNECLLHLRSLQKSQVLMTTEKIWSEEHLPLEEED